MNESEDIAFKVIVCPMTHKIIVADTFPFEYKNLKCIKCKKEYEITPKGRIRFKEGKAISQPLIEPEPIKRRTNITNINQV